MNQTTCRLKPKIILGCNLEKYLTFSKLFLNLSCIREYSKDFSAEDPLFNTGIPTFSQSQNSPKDHENVEQYHPKYGLTTRH